MSKAFLWGFFQCAAPDDSYAPTEFLELGNLTLIPSNSGSYLLVPETPVCLWKLGGTASVVTMPEATVNEDDSVELGQNDIRAPGEALHILSKSETSLVKL